jgi:hypothetical protein
LDCYYLTSIIIPNSVTFIGRCAFAGCYYTTSVSIGNSVTIIGDGAFYSCGNLPSVTIPNSVTIIGWGSFQYCTKLTAVTIGSSVTTIGNGAFQDCSNIDSIICETSVPPAIGERTFKMMNYSTSKYELIPATVYVPCGSLAAYQAAGGWSELNCQVIGFPSPDSVWVLQQETVRELGWENIDSVLGYEIYRNNALLAATTSTIYRDSNLANGEYCYKIKAIYASCESGFSPEVCKTNDLGINSLHVTRNALQIYPNPTDGTLRITNYDNSIANYELRITDVVGQVVGAYCIRPENTETTIDISHLAKGMYFLKIDGKVFKVVKQ